MATLLDDAALTEALTGLDDWHGDAGSISRVVHLDESKVDGFLVQLETVAREMNHDPDLARTGDELTVTMSTHSAGGVTELDVEYARRVDQLLRESL